MVTIISKTYNEGGWSVECRVELKTGTRSGLEYVSLGEDVTDEDLTTAILKAYS